MAESDSSSPERKPLLEWLLRRYPDTPKTRAKQWVLAGRVRVGGEVLRKPHELIPDPGTTLELLERHATSIDLSTAWPIHPRVTLLHLDASLAIVNKGPGLLSIPGDTSEISALSIVADFLTGSLKVKDLGGPGRTLPASFRHLHPLPVHRLDKFTSGAFCMAMNPRARQRLIEQLRAHKIRREYVAFVEGRPAQLEGTWRHWLELSRDQIQQRVVPDGGRGARDEASEAVTHYQAVAEYRLRGTQTIITRMRMRLETGLKHQLRVQAAAEGLPIIGDRVYNPHYRHGASSQGFPEFPRQALHAAVIGLEHPDRPGDVVTWKAELPPDLRQLEAALRRGAH